MTFDNDIFYNMGELDLPTKKCIINDAFQVSQDFWVDILDCRKSLSRQRIDMSFEDIMKKFNDHSICAAAIRRGLLKMGQIMFRTATSPEYFLWIELDVPDMKALIKKYGLPALN